MFCNNRNQFIRFFVRAKVTKKNDIRDLQNCNCLHKTCTLKKICKVNELFLGK